jgi:sugar phosphate isomerase/epimerase
MTISRREFLQRASAASVAAAVPWNAGAEPPAHRWKLIAFSKPFRTLSYDDTADLVAEVGWDGIECPVRKYETHIVPERVEEELPKMVEALHRRGRELSMITTDITGVGPRAESVLRTAARLGIRRYRLGELHYTADKPVTEQLASFTARLRDLAQLNHSLGIQGGIQNHSGADYFGAPVWDAFEALRDLRPADMGMAFDIGHAALEGGLSWPIQARLTQPRYSVVYVKDFWWEKQSSGWKPVWCPLGEGMVSKTFFETLAKSSFDGPLCQHHEYELGKTRAEQVRSYKADLKTLRAWIGVAPA